MATNGAAIDRADAAAAAELSTATRNNSELLFIARGMPALAAGAARVEPPAPPAPFEITVIGAARGLLLMGMMFLAPRRSAAGAAERELEGSETSARRAVGSFRTSYRENVGRELAAAAAAEARSASRLSKVAAEDSSASPRELLRCISENEAVACVEAAFVLLRGAPANALSTVDAAPERRGKCALRSAARSDDGMGPEKEPGSL